jgi:hypothetical protein
MFIEVSGRWRGVQHHAIFQLRVNRRLYTPTPLNGLSKKKIHHNPSHHFDFQTKFVVHKIMCHSQMMATFLKWEGINIKEKLIMIGHKKLVHVGAMSQKFAKQLYHHL